MRIVFPDGAACIADPEELAPLREIGEVVVHESIPTTREELITRLQGAEAVVLDYSKVDGEVMERCPSVRHICFLGIGYHAYVDVEAATRRGIVVTYTPDYGSTAVAEHTLLLALALARKLVAADASVRAGRWEPGRLQGTELRGKTWGVVGLGPIGQEVARLAAGIGMRVIAWTRNPSPERQRHGITYRSLAELFSEADVVSLHLAHTPETERIVSAELLRRMKGSALFINTARAHLVDNVALLKMLREGRLGGAALDVYEAEPLPEDSEWRGLDNVVLTPHMGFNTRESAANMLHMAMENVISIAKGQPQNVVNPQVLGAT